MKVNIVNFDNDTVGDIELAPEIFGVEVRSDILSRVIHWQLAKRRSGTHKTKTVSDVRGTTKKPFRQKGTGNARQGSLRSPHMRGGGDVFGRQVRSYDYALPKKIRKLGLKCALASKVADQKIIVLDSFVLDSFKTKDFVQKVNNLGLKSALFIGGTEINENFQKAISNIIGCDVMPSQGANVYDIMNHHHLIVTKEALENIESRLK